MLKRTFWKVYLKKWQIWWDCNTRQQNMSLLMMGAPGGSACDFGETVFWLWWNNFRQKFNLPAAFFSALCSWCLVTNICARLEHEIICSRVTVNIQTCSSDMKNMWNPDMTKQHFCLIVLKQAKQEHTFWPPPLVGRTEMSQRVGIHCRLKLPWSVT